MNIHGKTVQCSKLSSLNSIYLTIKLEPTIYSDDSFRIWKQVGENWEGKRLRSQIRESEVRQRSEVQIKSL